MSKVFLAFFLINNKIEIWISVEADVVILKPRVQPVNRPKGILEIFAQFVQK